MNTNAQKRERPAHERSASNPACEKRKSSILLAETSRDLEGRPPLTTPLQVLYFAQAAEAAGCRSETWEITAPITPEQFWQEAIRRHPDLVNLRGKCRLAVNHAFLAHPGESIPPQSEVAVLPPVSGG